MFPGKPSSFLHPDAVNRLKVSSSSTYMLRFTTDHENYTQDLETNQDIIVKKNQLTPILLEIFATYSDTST
jgi:hypothetical protein